MMKVSIVGTGNVATILAKKLFNANYKIQFIYGRKIVTAQEIAKLVDADATQNLKDIKDDNDVVIIATNDKAIEEVTMPLHFESCTLIHTAGSVSKYVLENNAANFGVLYPIQSIRKNMDINTRIPFLIDANNEIAKKKLENLAWSISNYVEFGDDQKRLKLHTAAVFACNFVNYMYLQSANFCEENHIDFKLLQPLIEETAIRLQQFHPKDVFTGPAVRKDMETIEKHLQQLANNLQAKSLYKNLSELIMNYNK